MMSPTPKCKLIYPKTNTVDYFISGEKLSKHVEILHRPINPFIQIYSFIKTRVKIKM